MGRGRGGRRTQRKHLKEPRENVWKRSKTDEESAPNEDGTTTTNDGEQSTNPHWQSFVTHNAAFEEYYKVTSFPPISVVLV